MTVYCVPVPLSADVAVVRQQVSPPLRGTPGPRRALELRKVSHRPQRCSRHAIQRDVPTGRSHAGHTKPARSYD